MVESGFQFGEPSESALWHFATAVTIRDIVATLLAIRASADIISIRRCWLPAVCFQNVKEGNRVPADVPSRIHARGELVAACGTFPIGAAPGSGDG